MIKARAKMADGRHLLVLGLSEANLARLREHQPIFFDMASLDIPVGEVLGAVTIFYGANEVACSETLRSLIGPTTKIKMVPKGPEDPQ